MVGATWRWPYDKGVMRTAEKCRRSRLLWPRLGVSEGEVADVRRLFTIFLNVLDRLCPGAEFGPGKTLAAYHYAELAKQLINGVSGRTVWLGKDHEEAESWITAALASSERNCRFGGKPSWSRPSFTICAAIKPSS